MDLNNLLENIYSVIENKNKNTGLYEIKLHNAISAVTSQFNNWCCLENAIDETAFMNISGRVVEYNGKHVSSITMVKAYLMSMYVTGIYREDVVRLTCVKLDTLFNSSCSIEIKIDFFNMLCLAYEINRLDDVRYGQALITVSPGDGSAFLMNYLMGNLFFKKQAEVFLRKCNDNDIRTLVKLASKNLTDCNEHGIYLIDRLMNDLCYGMHSKNNAFADFTNNFFDQMNKGTFNPFEHQKSVRSNTDAIQDAISNVAKALSGEQVNWTDRQSEILNAISNDFGINIPSYRNAPKSDPVQKPKKKTIKEIVEPLYGEWERNALGVTLEDVCSMVSRVMCGKYAYDIKYTQCYDHSRLASVLNTLCVACASEWGTYIDYNAVTDVVNEVGQESAKQIAALNRQAEERDLLNLIEEEMRGMDFGLCDQLDRSAMTTLIHFCFYGEWMDIGPVDFSTFSMRDCMMLNDTLVEAVHEINEKSTVDVSAKNLDWIRKKLVELTSSVGTNNMQFDNKTAEEKKVELMEEVNKLDANPDLYPIYLRLKEHKSSYEFTNQELGVIVNLTGYKLRVGPPVFGKMTWTTVESIRYSLLVLLEHHME